MYRGRAGAAAARLSLRRRHHTLFPMQGGAQVFEAAGTWRGAGAQATGLRGQMQHLDKFRV